MPPPIGGGIGKSAASEKPGTGGAFLLTANDAREEAALHILAFWIDGLLATEKMDPARPLAPSFRLARDLEGSSCRLNP